VDDQVAAHIGARIVRLCGQTIQLGARQGPPVPRKAVGRDVDPAVKLTATI
jgi:hypothetical protein